LLLDKMQGNFRLPPIHQKALLDLLAFQGLTLMSLKSGLRT